MYTIPIRVRKGGRVMWGLVAKCDIPHGTYLMDYCGKVTCADDSDDDDKEIDNTSNKKIKDNNIKDILDTLDSDIQCDSDESSDFKKQMF